MSYCLLISVPTDCILECTVLLWVVLVSIWFALLRTHSGGFYLTGKFHSSTIRLSIPLISSPPLVWEARMDPERPGWVRRCQLDRMRMEAEQSLRHWEHQPWRLWSSSCLALCNQGRISSYRWSSYGLQGWKTWIGCSWGFGGHLSRVPVRCVRPAQYILPRWFSFRSGELRFRIENYSLRRDRCRPGTGWRGAWACW